MKKRTSEKSPDNFERAGVHRHIDPELLPVIQNRPPNMGPVCLDNLEEVRRLSDEARELQCDAVPEFVAESHVIESEDGEVVVRVFRPKALSGPNALLWFHGGGYIMGSSDDLLGRQFAVNVDCTVFSVEYRLAPEHSHPAAVNDGIAALRWLRNEAESLGVGDDKIAIAGASAGAGLAAGVTLLNRDSNGPMPVFQLLLYPMLDNLHDTVSGKVEEYPIWSRQTSLNAWTMYLGGSPGTDASPYAAPGRATDLSGLPPTFLGVGDVDLFRDENIAFVQKLIADGSVGELKIYPGVYHAAEWQYPDAAISQRMIADTFAALRAGFN